MNKNDILTCIKNGIKNIPANEFNYILEKLFDIKKIDIISDKFYEKIDFNLLNSVLEKRFVDEPLQYIFNEAYFRNYIFYVDKRVLIPRPETELLVEHVIEINNKYFSDLDKINIVDIGTGSGAIAISLAMEIKKSEVYTVDISEKALEVAEINMEKYLKDKDNLKLVHGDKLEIFKNSDIKFDILVSNPPYIKYTDYINLEKNVLDYEPKLALLGTEDDGTGFYKYFAENAYRYLNKNGFVCFEIAYDQGLKVADILNKNGFKNIEIIQDYASIDRIVSAKL